jgi:hypothetical protein
LKTTIEGLQGAFTEAEDAELMANILQGVGEGPNGGEQHPLPKWATKGAINA